LIFNLTKGAIVPN